MKFDSQTVSSWAEWLTQWQGQCVFCVSVNISQFSCAICLCLCVGGYVYVSTLSVKDVDVSSNLINRLVHLVHQAHLTCSSSPPPVSNECLCPVCIACPSVTLRLHVDQLKHAHILLVCMQIRLNTFKIANESEM